MRFEDLEVWKRSARLSAELYKSLRSLKDFAYRDQTTRSALSIPSNIAEGWERNSKKEFSQYLKYALGSCGELRTQLYIGIEAEYLNREQGQLWIKKTRELSAMLRSLQSATIAEEPDSTYEA